MATKLTKDISRETLAVTDTKGNVQIITLKAGDILEFRPKGRRIRYEVPLQACYNMALVSTFQEIYKRRVQKYNEAKHTGAKARRPKPLPRIFNARVYEALGMK